MSIKTKVEVRGTFSDGTFIAKITHRKKALWAYYPADYGDYLILHEYPDFITRFVVFSDNDESLHEKCKAILLRKNLEVDDKSRKGLELIFAEAMESQRKGCNEDKEK